MVSKKRFYMGRSDLFKAPFQYSLANKSKKKLRKNLYIINLIINHTLKILKLTYTPNIIYRYLPIL